MDKLISDILRHLRAMWRYRWLGLVTSGILAIATAAYVITIPKKYEASARIFVNTDSILKPLMQGMTAQPDNSQRVALLSRVVISRPNVASLIQETGIAAKAKTTEQRERLLDDVMSVLTIQNTGEKDNIYVVKFRDTEPERARLMVEMLVAKFIDSSKGGRTTDTDAAKQFLDEQAATYEKKLQEAESKLKDFKMKNMVGMLPGEGKDYFAQVAVIGDQLHQAQLQLREAENSRDAYRRGLAGEDISAPHAGGTNAAGEGVADIDARIDVMKRNLDGLLQKFTESHPDVVGTRRVIQELEQNRAKLIAEYRQAGIPLTRVSTGGPRASEQLKVSLAQAEASVASLRVRVSEYGTRYNQMRDMARRMPEFEAEYAQLTRDYESNKKSYENLVARRESASMASDMQSVAGVADFRLIDPPRVKPGAVSVSRALMVPAALLFSLLVGVGVMFVAKEIRTCFYDRAQLSSFSGLPVLGVISRVVSEQLRLQERKELMRFTQTAGALFGVYIVVLIAGTLLTRPVA